MQETIFQAVKAGLAELGVSEVDFVVERPGDLQNGDYATNAALVASKKVGKNPKEFAGELKKKLFEENGLEAYSDEGAEAARGPFRKKVFSQAIDRVEIAGPGFINFYLSKEAVTKEVATAATSDSWATNDLYAGKTVMVEYTQPNPFKEFHIGHLMSNTLGESICRLLEQAGAKVIRVNYQGDVGPHVAKAMHVLLERGQLQPTIEEISNAYVEGSRRYEEDPKEKEAIDSLNKLIYQQYENVSEQKVWDLYQYGRSITLEHFEELYAMLGTHFDHYFFESETGARGLAMVHSHPEVFVESEGAIVFHAEEYGLHTRVFINRLGLPTYETKDLGLTELKKEYAPFDISITTTAKEQDDYFKVVFKALELMHPDWAGQFRHVSHGMMRFASGKMSSRKGNVITGESLLNDLTEASKEKMQGRELKDANKTAEQVAVGAIKFAVLKQGSGKDIVFDPEKSLSLEGDSGPYLQYALTRARSLLRKADMHAAEANTPLAKGEAWPSGLEHTLIHFPEVVARAARELEPHYVTTFLTELASLFNSWYANSRVIGSEDEARGILLTQAFARTMERGLNLLGIPAPEEM